MANIHTKGGFHTAFGTTELTAGKAKVPKKTYPQKPGPSKVNRVDFSGVAKRILSKRK